MLSISGIRFLAVAGALLLQTSVIFFTAVAQAFAAVGGPGALLLFSSLMLIVFPSVACNVVDGPFLLAFLLIMASLLLLS